MTTYTPGVDTPLQGYETEIDLWEIDDIEDIPNRELNQSNLKSIRSQLETFEDIKKFPPLHVGQRGTFNTEQYPLINGYHRLEEYRHLWMQFLKDNGYDLDNDEDLRNIPPVMVRVVVRTDIHTREDVIHARYADNTSHGFPPTSKERRNYALFLAESRHYPEGITQGEIGRLCGLDRTTVSRLLKKKDHGENNTSQDGEESGYSIVLENHAANLLKSAEKFFNNERAFLNFTGHSEKSQQKRTTLFRDAMLAKELSKEEIQRIQSIAVSMYTATQTLLPSRTSSENG
jgi:predicted transcriptional regulator